MQIRRRKLKFVSQLESSDCGPACLAMIAAYYGKKYKLRDIKQFCSVTRMGVAVKDIISGAKKMGFEAISVKLSIDELQSVELPTILYWKQNHFIVLYKIKQGATPIYYIADPRFGKVKLHDETLKKGWLGTNSKGVGVLFDYDNVSQPDLLNGLDLQKEKKEDTFWKEVSGFISANKWKYIISFVFLIAGLIANWAIPIVFQKTIDLGISKKSLNIVWALLLAQMFLFLGNAVSRIVSDLILTKITFRFTVSLKENFLFKLLRLPISYFDTKMNVDTLQRLSDQNRIQNFITWRVVDIFLNILNIFAFSVILYNMNQMVFFASTFLSSLSIIWTLYFLSKRKVIEYSSKLRQAENNNLIYEFVMNMPEIKVNSAQNTMIKRLSKIQKSLNILEFKSFLLVVYQNTGISFLSKIREIVSIAICAYLIINGKLTIGTLLSISYVLGQLSAPLSNLISYSREAQDANIAQKRVREVYLETEENPHDEAKVPLPAYISIININNISFKYPGSFNPYVLDNVSFTIPRNKITAIVGASGSGKTTLLKLLLSYYPPSSGSILVNAELLENINSDEWRQQCGTVLQDGHIFAGTIAENIAISNDEIDLERLHYSTSIACIDEFINELPMKYHTKIGSVGMQLSGGQKQRLLIARSVYRNPEFLFFDEATSSLDANNEKQIMKNLNSFFKGKTVIIVAHRLSTVKNADQIIVLKDGRIVEQGNHDDLVCYKGNYFELVRNQLELGN